MNFAPMEIKKAYYNRSDIGKRLKQIRCTDLNISQQEFAKLLKVSQQCISFCELAKVDIPARSLIVLCIDMNYNLNWLITGKGVMQIKK